MIWILLFYVLPLLLSVVGVYFLVKRKQHNTHLQTHTQLNVDEMLYKSKSYDTKK